MGIQFDLDFGWFTKNLLNLFTKLAVLDLFLCIDDTYKLHRPVRGVVSKVCTYQTQQATCCSRCEKHKPLTQPACTCCAMAAVRYVCCRWHWLQEEYLPSSLGTVDDFMTDAVMKAAFLTLIISFSSFTDRRSAKAPATSVVGKPDSDSAALQMSVNLPSGLSCSGVLDL